MPLYPIEDPQRPTASRTNTPLNFYNISTSTLGRGEFNNVSAMDDCSTCCPDARRRRLWNDMKCKWKRR